MRGPIPGGAILAVVCLVALGAGCLAGCGSGKPRVVHDTVTSYATDTVTAMVTVTASATVVQTVTATPANAPVAVPSMPALGGGDGTDKAAVVMHAGWVVRDVQTADQRIASGYDAGLDTTMSFLATDFSDLQSDGPPPGSDATHYLATCQTLSTFADEASQEYTAGDDTAASARYAVMRQHVNEVLDAVNTAYGTHLSV